MKKIIKLGKIDYLGIGRKTCPVEVEVELRDTPTGKEFAASGTIWNHIRTDCYCGGQCLDIIAGYIKTPEFNEILRLWKRWHLNTMNAGDREQELAVKEYLQTHSYNYDEVCKYLDSVGLLIHDDYKYGTSWLTEQIDKEDLETMNKLFESKE